MNPSVRLEFKGIRAEEAKKLKAAKSTQNKNGNFVSKKQTMSTPINTLREKLHHYIDHVEDKKIKAFYTIVQTDIEEEDIFTAELKAELDELEKLNKAGKLKSVTLAQIRKEAHSRKRK